MTCLGGGGGVSIIFCWSAMQPYKGGGKFAFQIDREIFSATFRVLREFLAPQQYTLWTLAGGGGVPHKIQGTPQNFPQRNLAPRF